MNTGIRSRTRWNVIVIALVIGALLLPAQAVFALTTVGFQEGTVGDFDARTGTVAPGSSQISAVNALNAKVTWNKFGTPHSLIKYGGFLATGLGGATAADAARSWLNSHKSLFKLTSTDASVLETVTDIQLVKSKGHAVVFRQVFGGVPAVQDGMVNLGLVGTSGSWKLAYVSSTLAPSAGAPAAAQITAQQAWLAAAHDAGLNSTAGDIYKVQTEGDWTAFIVGGLKQMQLARLRALPIPGNGVRPVFEVDVQKVQGATAVAYVSLVDAVDKKVWFRMNAVDEAAAEPLTTPVTATAAPVTGFFAGTTLATGCGPAHPIPTAVTTKAIDIAATANIPASDIVLKLIKNGVTIVSQDTGTSPEAIHYGPAGGVPVGTYTAQVCAFNTGEIFPYTGFWVTNDQAVQQVPYPPEWKAFKNSPKLDYTSTDNRTIYCWEDTVSVTDCNLVIMNTASRAPWDFDVATNSPTFTSVGNNAKTAEAWASPLTPSENYSPPSANRKYYFPFTDQWNNSGCNPTVFSSAARNDVDASIINLFAGHNRFHDFSYFLGFTEQAWNMQQNNFGNGQPGPFPGNEGDPEVGNVQAGAVDGGAPEYRGRDNANQITLQDGVPGITNQYLFQPIPGGFYAPCVDGSFDTTVFGHEYTHAISNRMVGGPDSGLTGDQAGSMGESWSDLNALEYLQEYNIPPAGNVSEWALGPYATGNPIVGIRNYALDNNPLNFSDIGYDSACNANLIGPPVEDYCSSRSEVHSDGEIWNAVNYSIRALLVSKYNGNYPESNATMQKACADGKRAPETCPGNRRWIQIVYDAWLMMPPDVTMLGARDAYLAADMMRFGGANQKELWRAFARRGMGSTASTTSTDDADPKPGWTSPKENNGKVTFVAVNENGQPVKAKIFVGNFEAGVTPSADTDPATALSNQLSMVPGRYTMIASAPGYGHLRFGRIMDTGNQTATLHFYSNWASSTKGATAGGDGGNFADLIDDTEATNWAIIGAAPSVIGKRVNVTFTTPHQVGIVQVSTMNHPADSDDDYDADPQNRFSTLRSFDIYGCLGTVGNAQCSGVAGWVKIGHFVDAFKAGIPRPLMPNLYMQQFDVTNMVADHIRLVVLDNQCTGNPAYAGEQDNDPTNSTDCEINGGQAGNVHVAELQAMGNYPYVVPDHGFPWPNP
jgi:extracellular elastinolytic metalloproteinase